MQGKNTCDTGKYDGAGLMAIVAMTVAVTACGFGANASPEPAPPDTGEETVVIIEAATFDPTDTVVTTGSKVAWRWAGGVAHDVTSGSFASDIQTDGTFRHTFDEVGTYDYWCNLHPGMKGTVTVVSS
jgi:plastocyanin